MSALTNHSHVWEHEVAYLAIRAQGPGGQNVNKVSCAVQLRFDVRSADELIDQIGLFGEHVLPLLTPS